MSSKKERVKYFCPGCNYMSQRITAHNTHMASCDKCAKDLGVESTIKDMTTYLEEPVEKEPPQPTKQEQVAIREHEAVIKRVEKHEADILKEHLKEKAKQSPPPPRPQPTLQDTDDGEDYQSLDPARVGADQIFNVWRLTTKGLDMMTPRIEGLEKRVLRRQPRYIYHLSKILTKRGMGTILSDEVSLAMLAGEDILMSHRRPKKKNRKVIGDMPEESEVEYSYEEGLPLY